jgi:uncharacterized protein (TIGR02996 family)
MTHDEAFLAAVREAPDDDAPRLLYADWLEERGDPRGAFIRAQCVLERFDPADPVRQELEEQTAALLGRHEKEWTAPLREMASDWRFRRGFVEEVTVSGADFLRRGGDLFAAFPVTRLRLELSRAQVADVARSLHLAQVRFLDVSSCKLRDGDVTTLLDSPHLTRLTDLDLSANEVEGPAVLALVGSPLLGRLTSLNLRANHSLGGRAARALAQAPAAASLRSLDLSFTNIGPGGLRDLLASAFLTGLTALRAANVGLYSMTGLRAAELAAGPVLPRLTLLDLGGFPDALCLSALLHSPALGRVTSLSLAKCPAGREWVEELARSPHLTRLRILDLTGSAVGPKGLEQLASSENLTGLNALHLGHNGVRDSGAKALAASTIITRLTVLDLSHNEIGGPGLLALAAWPNLTRLTSLDVSGNYIGAENAALLKKRFGKRVEL